MADSLVPGPPPPPGSFRWQAFFQQASEPIFVLNQRWRILFVNRAWEELTGWPAAEARGKTCSRRKSNHPILRALCPPPEVIAGKTTRSRRLVPGIDLSRRWWDVEFMPLGRGDDCRGLLGKISIVPPLQAFTTIPLPEGLVALREAMAQRYAFALFDSELPALGRAREQAGLASQVLLPVLITGEPGTGKHWLARTIHHQGIARERSFAALDCAHLPGSALAFLLGGDGGLLEQSGLGTLYLREPASLPRDLQALVLERLQEPKPAGPRIIASCTQFSREGTGLDEFFSALATQWISLPPLRERRADLPNLVERMLREAGPDRPDQPAANNRIAPDAWTMLHAYAWPGNLRELRAALSAARALASGETIEPRHLPSCLRQTVTLEQTRGREAERSLPLDRILEEVERRLIVLALRKCQDNKSRAAELLSIWRQRLLRRMETLGIEDSTGKAPREQEHRPS